jgi:DNA-binding transcriptional regulator GbsR (MarR family)
MGLILNNLMQNIRLLEGLFDEKIIKIIKFFLLNKDKEFYLQEIVRETGVPLASVFRIVKKLVELQVVSEMHIKKFKLYKCADNENIHFLESFMKEGRRIIDNFAANAGKLENVEEVILYGQETEDKANVLLIGKNIISSEIKQLCSEFREKHKYIITDLCLEREQYAQMLRMGLYSGKKKTLFKK